METWQNSVEKIEWNDEILTEILLHVPEKTLVQLKLVSKRWLSLITGPYFRSLYAKSARRHTCALFMVPYIINRSDEWVTLRSHDVDPSGWWRDVRVLSSCNGLILAIGLSALFEGRKQEDLIVWNPRLNRFSRLPNHVRPIEVWGFSIAFDPLKSSSYKVIALSSKISSSFKVLDAHTYTSSPDGEGKWKYYTCDSIRLVSSSWGHNSYRNNYWNSSTYWNGDVYWLAPYDHLVYFSTAQDKLGITQRPLAPRGYENLSDVLYEHLSESRGCLYLLQIYTTDRDNPSFTLYVYTMKSSRSEWSLMHCSCFDVVLEWLPREVKQRLSTSLLQRRLWLLHSLRWFNVILGLIHSGEDENELLLVLQLHQGEGGRKCPVICYNITQQSSYTLLDLPDKNTFWRKVVLYVPSLAYPPSLTCRS